MNYAGIKKADIANGPGIRVSLFVSGCRNHCPGCFNPETWNFDYGEPFTKQTEEELIMALRPSWIQGLSILGGDPMEPENQEALLPFLRRVKEEMPEKDTISIMQQTTGAHGRGTLRIFADCRANALTGSAEIVARKQGSVD